MTPQQNIVDWLCAEKTHSPLFATILSFWHSAETSLVLPLAHVWNAAGIIYSFCVGRAQTWWLEAGLSLSFVTSRQFPEFSFTESHNLNFIHFFPKENLLSSSFNILAGRDDLLPHILQFLWQDSPNCPTQGHAGQRRAAPDEAGKD